MFEMKQVSIKPNKTLSNDLHNKLTKTNLTRLEQCVLVNVAGWAGNAAIIQKVISLTDEECNTFEIAPIETKRFSSALVMAIKECFRPTFKSLDGHTTNSSILLDFDSQKLEKAFGLYASGSFRRENIRAFLGEDLEILIPDNNIMRPKTYNVTVDVQYGYVDNILQIKTYTTHKNVDNFITRTMSKNIKPLINDLNNKLKQMEK